MSSLLHYFIFSAKLAVLPAIWIDSIHAWIYPWELPRWLRGKESGGNAEAAGGTEWIPEWGRSSGEGNGNPLQYSCLKNPTDRGAWQATVSRVAESQTRLSSWAQPFGNFSSRWTRMGTQLSVVPSQTPGSKLPIYVHLSWFCDFTCLLEELNTLDLGHEFFLKVRLKISGSYTFPFPACDDKWWPPGFEEFVVLTGLLQGSLPRVKFGGSTLSVPGFYMASYLNLE